MGYFGRMQRIHAITAVVAILCANEVQPQTGSALSYSGLQPFNELNSPNGGDGYPWISADGLRLYFAQSGSPNIRILYTERSSIGAAWSSPVDPLPLETGETSGAWLSQDELTIWFTTASNAVRKATRASTSDPFAAAISLTLTGVSGTLRCPSLTPDEEHLLLWRNSSNVVLERTAPNTYAQVSPLDMQGAASAGPCRLSANGLMVYFGASYGGVTRPHRMSRASLTDEFAELEYLSGSEFASGYTWIQPILTPDESMLIVVRGVSLWPDNDLYEAQGAISAGIAEAWEPVPLLHPVPADERVAIELPAGWPSAQVRLMDVQGRIVLESAVYRAEGSFLDVRALPPGRYSVVLKHAKERGAAVLVVAH